MWANAAYPSLKPLGSWVKDLVLRTMFIDVSTPNVILFCLVYIVLHYSFILYLLCFSFLMNCFSSFDYKFTVILSPLKVGHF